MKKIAIEITHKDIIIMVVVWHNGLRGDFCELSILQQMAFFEEKLSENGFNFSFDEIQEIHKKSNWDEIFEPYTRQEDYYMDELKKNNEVLPKIINW